MTEDWLEFQTSALELPKSILVLGIQVPPDPPMVCHVTKSLLLSYTGHGQNHTLGISLLSGTDLSTGFI